MPLAAQLLCISFLAAISMYLLRVSLRKARTRMSAVDYFLGGGAIGPGATLRNNIGANWALATSIWFYFVVGQQNGVAAALALQFFWALGILMLGSRLLPAILHATANGYTLHGFLGAFYQSHVLRITFAILACLYYLLAFAFEIIVGANIIASQLNPDPRLAITLAAAMALLPAIYISVSGFKGNVAGDRLQNIIGITSLLVFAGGIIAWFFTTKYSGGLSLLKPGSKSFDITAARAIGLIVANSFLNFVDVANWQTAAANVRLAGPTPRDVAPKVLDELKRPWRWTAFTVMFVPALLCAWLGSMLQGQTLTDQEIIPAFFDLSFQGLDVSLRYGLLAVILAGFFVLSIGFAENVLSAAQLILVADILRPRHFDRLRSSFDTRAKEDNATVEEERFLQFTRRATLLVIGLAAGVVAVLFLIRTDEGKTLSDSLANLWWMLWVFLPSILCMTAPVLYASRSLRRGVDASRANATLGAMGAAVVGVLMIFAMWKYEKQLAELGTAVGLGISTLVFFTMFLVPESLAKRLLGRTSVKSIM